MPTRTTPQKGTTTTEESENNNNKDMEKKSPTTTTTTTRNEASTGKNNNDNDENCSTPEKKQHPKEHDDEEENNEKKKAHQQGSPTSVISSNNDIDININTSSLTDDANSVVSTASSRTNDDRIRTRLERRRLRRSFQEKKQKKKKQQNVRVSVYSVSSPESNYLENTKSAASGNPTIQSVMMMNDLNLNNGNNDSTNNLNNTNTSNTNTNMSSDSISNNTVTQSINSSITHACMPAGIVSVAEAGCKKTGLLDNDNNCGIASRKSHCDTLMNDSTCSFPNTTSLNDSACTDISDDPSVLFSQAVDFLLPEEEKSKRKYINNKKSSNRGGTSSQQEHGGELGIEIMPGDGGTISVEEVSNIIYNDDSNSNSSKENNTPATELVSSQDNENTTNTIEDHMSPMARMRYIREKKNGNETSKDPPIINKSFSGTGSTSSSTVITKNTTNKKSSPRKNKKKKNSANTSFDSWFKGDWVGGNGGAECNDVNSGADALVNQTLKIPEMFKNILSNYNNNGNDGTCGGMAIQDGMNMNLSFFHDDEEELSSSGSEEDEEDDDEEEYYDDGQTLSGDETSHASTISEESSESDLSSNNTNKNKSRRNREASDDDDESEDETNGEFRNKQALDTNNATATSTTGGPSSSSDSAAAEGPLSQYYRKSSFDTPTMESNDMNNKQSGSAKPANSTGMIDDIIASSEDSKNTATGGILKNGKKNNNTDKQQQQQKKTQAQDNNSKKKAPQVVDPCGDPKFLEMFVEEVINVGLSLTWHKEQSTQFYEKPKTVIACIELGRCVSSNAHHNTHTSTFAEPKFVWDAQDDIINLSESFENSRNNNNDDESSKIHKIDLFDIISIEKAGIMNFHSYPFAIPGNSFFVTLSDGSSFLFEAKDSEEQHRIISGLHRLISRFTYNLIAGEIDVCWDLFACSGESLEMDDISPESLTVEELDLWFISKAMNDVTHLLFEKSCNQVMDEDEV